MCKCTFVPHTKGAGFCGSCDWNYFFTCSKRTPDSHFYSFWFSHCNFLSLQRCVRSWIRSLAACNPLFQCTPQNQNYMLGLQARLDTICRHEYLIWCQRGCSKHSLSSFIILSETNAWKQSWLCGFYLGRLCPVTVFRESQQSWYISFLLISFWLNHLLRSFSGINWWEGKALCLWEMSTVFREDGSSQSLSSLNHV